MENEIKAMLFVIALSLAAGAYAYSLFPETVAVHWDIEGNADGFAPRELGAFLMPSLLLLLLAMFIGIPLIDPLKANIGSFRSEYLRFGLIIMLFLSIVHIQAISWNLGTRVSFGMTMPVLLGALFIYLGHFLPQTKRNWSIGIRTPWTLSSDEVWEKTHDFGSKAFMAAGALMMLGVLLPAQAFLIIIVLAVITALGTAAYSYFAYRESGIKSGKGK